MQEKDCDTPSSSSSFLNLLQNRLQGGLKPTKTKTTFPDGSVQYSTCQGNAVEESNEVKKGFGFVVDEKPDLTIGKVRPWLYVSSQDVPNDAKLLKEHNISHVLSLLPGFLLTKECADIIAENHLILDVFDDESFELDSALYKKTFGFIDNARKQSGNVVLLHCNAGISRAPTFAIAYLMKTEKLSFDDAFTQLKSVRPGIKPNAGFLRQLQKMQLKQ